jgi:hypothetical protein
MNASTSFRCSAEARADDAAAVVTPRLLHPCQRPRRDRLEGLDLGGVALGFHRLAGEHAGGR